MMTTVVPIHYAQDSYGILISPFSNSNQGFGTLQPRLDSVLPSHPRESLKLDGVATGTSQAVNREDKYDRNRWPLQVVRHMCIYDMHHM